MTVLRLADVCDLQIGFRHQTGKAGDELGIAISDLDLHREHVDEFPVPGPGRLWLGNLESVAASGKKGYFLREGDVLFLSRGQRRVAVPVLEAYVQPWPPDWDRIVVLYYFFILRIKNNKLLPAFLAWLLNNGPLQAHVNMIAQGSLVQGIKVPDLLELSFRLPPVETQRKIVALYELSQREHRLTERLAAQRLTLFTGICRNLYEGSHVEEHGNV